MLRLGKYSVAILIATVGLASAEGQDASASLKALPTAVQKAIATETRGATITGVSKEVEAGKTVYEVETLVNGRTRDLVFASDGAVLVVEEQADLDGIPAAARAAIEKHAAGGRVATVEIVTQGTSVTYEATVVKRGQKTEVTVNADGRPAK